MSDRARLMALRAASKRVARWEGVQGRIEVEPWGIKIIAKAKGKPDAEVHVGSINWHSFEHSTNPDALFQDVQRGIELAIKDENAG